MSVIQDFPTHAVAGSAYTVSYGFYKDKVTEYDARITVSPADGAEISVAGCNETAPGIHDCIRKTINGDNKADFIITINPFIAPGTYQFQAFLNTTDDYRNPPQVIHRPSSSTGGGVTFRKPFFAENNGNQIVDVPTIPEKAPDFIPPIASETPDNAVNSTPGWFKLDRLPNQTIKHEQEPELLLTNTMAMDTPPELPLLPIAGGLILMGGGLLVAYKIGWLEWLI